MSTTFKIESAFQLKNRYFYVLGKLLSGRIKQGMLADFSLIGINKKIIIESVEFTLHKDDKGNGFENIALGFSAFDENEKKKLISNSPFDRSISIE